MKSNMNMPKHNTIITFQPPEHERLAILIGSAPKGKIQTKINDMVDFLTSDAGGAWEEGDFILMPQGISEKDFAETLAFYAAPKMFFYICMETPVADWEKFVWVGGSEISKSLFAKDKRLGVEDVQVIYDSCRDFVDFEIEYET